MILIKQSEDIPTVTQSDILALIKLRSQEMGGALRGNRLSAAPIFQMEGWL